MDEQSRAGGDVGFLSEQRQNLAGKAQEGHDRHAHQQSNPEALADRAADRAQVAAANGLGNHGRGRRQQAETADEEWMDQCGRKRRSGEIGRTQTAHENDIGGKKCDLRDLGQH